MENNGIKCIKYMFDDGRTVSMAVFEKGINIQCTVPMSDVENEFVGSGMDYDIDKHREQMIFGQGDNIVSRIGLSHEAFIILMDMYITLQKQLEDAES